MEKIFVEHCNFKREFNDVNNAIKHAEALTKLGYDSSVYIADIGLYEEKWTLIYKSLNMPEPFSAFYNFKLRAAR